MDLKKRIINVIICIIGALLVLREGVINTSQTYEVKCKMIAMQKPDMEMQVSFLQKQYRYHPSQEEYKLLCYMTFAEAGNQSYEGKVAVAEVILNRLDSDKFPDTIIEIISQKTQFSTYYDGGIRLANGVLVSDENINDEIRQAVCQACEGSYITEQLLYEEALQKGIEDPKYWEGGALYFCNLKNVDAQTRTRIEKVKVRADIEYHNFRRIY